ncbi:MAG: ABC transporter substrate-binding protein [Planctomycetes bacterium]|nr:ABC transporter substrate-binding protein [Planctomycetota bacterium]
MRNLFLITCVVVLSGVAWYINTDTTGNQAPEAMHALTLAEAPRRIVSLSPSITEILYALELGDKIAGVTRFCEYPPEAMDKQKVGGFMDPDYEAILRLNTDLIILRSDQEEAAGNLQNLGLQVLRVDHGNLAGILESIEIIGKTCHAKEQADKLLQELNLRMARIRAKTRNLARPRVLVSIGRTMGSGTLEDVCIAGKEGFYDELLRLAGGSNAYLGELVKFPILSPEALVQMAPEVVLDLAVGLEESGLSIAEVRRQWDTIPGFKNQNVRVEVLTDGYLVIPGPRFILILEEMARAIHPEVAWKEE